MAYRTRRFRALTYMSNTEIRLPEVPLHGLSPKDALAEAAITAWEEKHQREMRTSDSVVDAQVDYLRTNSNYRIILDDVYRSYRPLPKRWVRAKMDSRFMAVIRETYPHL